MRSPVPEEVPMTDYFCNDVLVKRPYIRLEWCLGALANPIRKEVQADDGRIRHWIFIPELDRYLRVVTLEDGVTRSQRISRQEIQTMRLSYDPETDSLYIHLLERPSADSNEVAEGVVLDFDEAGGLVGIDVQHASQHADISRLMLSRLPFKELEAA